MEIKLCSICFDETILDPCPICTDDKRDGRIVVVVAQPADTLVLKRSSFKGRYHVLHGVISPREGIGPDQLKIKALVERVQQNEIRELIFWLPQTMEGNATAVIIQSFLDQYGLLRNHVKSFRVSGTKRVYIDTISDVEWQA